MGGTVQVLRVAGIPIRIHASWLLVYALLTWSLAVGYFPQVLPDLEPSAYWAYGLLAALLLFAAVLLHELSHALVARTYGLEVRGITLHVFGGVAHLEEDAPTPRAEFLIAVAGPLTSFGIAAVLWLVLVSGAVGSPHAVAVIDYLRFINVAVGAFNLIPGFPLDGGRVLRALLWAWQGSAARATWLAARVGTAFAFGLMGLGVLQILGGALVGGFWTILIGLFLRSAADASYAQVALREALDRLPVRDIMTRDVQTVPPDASVAELGERFWAHHVTSFPVVGDGTVRGIASVHDLAKIPEERRVQAHVADVMRPLDADLAVRSGDPVMDAMAKAARNRLGRLAVIDDGRLVGYLSLKDITHVLALRGLPRLADADVPTPAEPPREVPRAA